MKILVLGGTQFVGRAAVAEAVSRGHEVTTLNRGTRAPEEGVTALVGDRLAPDGLRALEGRAFDTVIDTWPRDAAAVETAVDALRGRIGQFIYVSSISVYLPDDDPHFTEDSPVLDPDTSDFRYGADKRRGELAAQASGVPTVIARPGLILGPHEGAKGRIPWWLNRMLRGGPTLAPGPPDSPLQFIDPRDLARFLVDAAEARGGGVYNTLSRPGHSTMRELLETCSAVTGGRAELRWVDPETVLAKGILPWTEMPVWMPPGKKHGYCFNVDVTKAFEAGLRVRPAMETIVDTWEWLRGMDESSESSTYGLGDLGLDPEKEMAALE
ncbi:reductase [Phialemonium atrogriseum]|uniref:Reductase n=1 Tax=Phialemonium atrogriseum TaxID=1093897 RepID=A0AAJ0C2N6_9PEZI|nr:reductase [Phialemonium atrogriseum]KAK1769029.1 reductase [Phialemonium atrogriseum]